MPTLEKPGPSHIVGIGASAGGLEALIQFFDHLPGSTGLAFVLIQHLAPDYKSMMGELLAKHTSMVVRIAEEGMPVTADTIFLIPPKHMLTIAGGTLHLEAVSHQHSPPLAIDRFLASLATEAGERAIAIILSGTGSDGTRGIRAVKEAGGIVLIQDIASARFDGMPRSAIATGLADRIAAADALPEAITDIVRSEDSVGERLITAGPELDRLLARLGEHSGVDFSEYKQSTILRRIERRMQVGNAADLRAYLDLLSEQPRELTYLYRDLLISVTRFFRDQSAFEVLAERVLPRLLEAHRDGSQVRVWVAACATGEEAYSIAILCREVCERTGIEVPIKIFATDLDRDAIEFASTGLYSESAVADLSPGRLARWFVHKPEGWQVTKAIREMVVFAAHNLMKDPPFRNIDLVSCRNVLIYFQPALQRRVLAIFQFSLVVNGYLFLGGSETLGDLSACFEAVDGRAKLFRTLAVTSSLASEHMRPLRSHPRPALPGLSQAPAVQLPLEDELERALVRSLLPACVVVDERGEVVHCVGDVSAWLSLPIGRPSLNLMKLAPIELSAVLAVGLRSAHQEHQAIHYRDICIGERLVHVTIAPLDPVPGKPGGMRLAAIAFRDLAHPAAVAPQIQRQQVDAQLIDLERELERTRVSLQAAIEEHETANEELQATNEELMAANEELQSTNEELQSVNEELYTVNAEYQAKIGELTEINNDLLNFLASTSIGTIFLDRNLCIRKFTPAVTEQINLIPQDIGRPLEHITRKILHDELVHDAEQVLHGLVPLTREVRAKGGRWYLMRILPYRTEDHTIRGVVITFVDITEVRSAKDDVRKFEAALAEIGTGVMICDAEGRVEYLNPAQAALGGYPPDIAKCPDHGLPVPGPAMPAVWESVSSGARWQGRVHGKGFDGQPYCEEMRVIPLLDNGRVVNLLKLAERG